MNLKAIIAIAIIIIVIPIVLSINSSSQGSCPNLKTSLSSVRKRRHLAFPPGSAAAISASVVKTFMTHIPSGWYFVVEVEVVYPLPDEKVMAMSFRKKLHHRQKRLAWELLQGALDGRNLNGRACVLRSICEAQVHLASKGKSLVHDILRSLFSTPLHDEEFVKEMDGTYNELLQSNFCEKANDCPFSVLKFILDMNDKKYYTN